MNPIAEGQRVPEVTWPIRVDGSWRQLTSAEVFTGKTVVLFSLPGAFTPTCSSSHVPRYQELVPTFRALGVDTIACVSVNDAFVMDAWKVDQGAHDVLFVPDGNGTFTEAMGMLVDKSAVAFGKRSWRYAMVVRDGVIEKLFVEPELPGDPFVVSDADTVLQYLGGVAPPDVLLFTRPGCSHCARAKVALSEAGLPYAELPVSPRILRALPGTRTTPQVFVNGAHVGGADELVTWLASR